MELNSCWPGAYSFQKELRIFLEYIRLEAETVLQKIEKADELVKQN